MPRCFPPHESCTTLSTQLRWNDEGACCQEMCVFTDCDPDHTDGTVMEQPDEYQYDDAEEGAEGESADACTTNADCCNADDTCMPPRGSTVKLCVGPTDGIGKTKSQGCNPDDDKPFITTTTTTAAAAATAAATAPPTAAAATTVPPPTTPVGCSDDPSVCGKGMFCLSCVEAGRAGSLATSECMPRVDLGGACSSGYGLTQCIGFQCRYGYRCQDYSTPSSAPFQIADHPAVCCPRVDTMDCGAGSKQLVDATGCLTSVCELIETTATTDAAGGSNGSAATLDVQGVQATTTNPPTKTNAGSPLFADAGSAALTPSSNAAGLEIGAPCFVADTFCPIASCSVPDGMACVKIEGAKTVRDMSMAGMGNMCCPQRCVFDCSGRGTAGGGGSMVGASAGGSGGGGGGGGGMASGAAATVVVVVLTLIGVIGFGSYFAVLRHRKRWHHDQQQDPQRPLSKPGSTKITIIGPDGIMYDPAAHAELFLPPSVASGGVQCQPPRYDSGGGGGGGAATVYGNGSVVDQPRNPRAGHPQPTPSPGEQQRLTLDLQASGDALLSVV